MRQYTIRRAILIALFQFNNPQSLGVLAFHSALCMAFEKPMLGGDDTIDLRNELEYLADHDFIERVEGFRNWYRLADSVRLALAEAQGKIDKSKLKTDARLYGPAAL